ncbi:MAG: glycosyltransferase family 4 protein [Vicinamibacterales bacterium]
MKLLVLLSRFPHPLDKGDKLRAFHQIAELARRHQITLCALSHSRVSAQAIAALSAHCDRIEVVRVGPLRAARGVLEALVTGLPLQVGYFLSASAWRKVEALVADVRPDRVLCQLVRTAEYARRLDVPVVFDYMDAFSWNLKQRAALQPALLGFLQRLEAKRLARYEADLVGRFLSSSITSTQDREQIAHPNRSSISIVGNGVDFDTFQPRATRKQYDLLFVGNMAYMPNVLAAEQLVREVLPRIRRERPCSVLIAGSTPSARVRRLAGNGVTVTGWVDDIGASYASARVFVAPLPIGTGVQNKLLQALAMEMPCVTSEPPRRALGAGDDEIWVGANADEIADRTALLLRDPDRAAELGRRGRAFALEHFQWSATAAAWEALWA